MSATHAKIQSIIENTIREAIKEYTASGSLKMTGDLYLYVDAETGELQVFNDEETLLSKDVIFNWVGFEGAAEAFNQEVISHLKAVINTMSATDVFENNCFVKPFSISLTDDEFNVIEELLFLDDETFRLDDPLLKDLDAELDEFLDNLLSDLD